MPRQPESGDGTGAPLPPVGAGILPGPIGPVVSAHFADPAADAAFLDADGGLWLRRYGEDAVPAGTLFTPAEVGFLVDAVAAGPGRLPGPYAEGFVTAADIEVFAARPPAVARPGTAVHRRTPARLDRDEDRRLGCLMTLHAQSLRHALDRLSRLLGRTRRARPAPGAAALAAAVVFARSPAAVWKVLDPAA